MKKGVAILGATGAVGQQFVRFLCDNLKFEIECLTASPRSVGKRYSEAAQWHAEFSSKGMPEKVRGIIVQETSVESINRADNIDLVFSALPYEQSKEIEPKLAKEGKIVISKSSAYRMDPLVPLIIPEVNPNHIDLLKVQRKVRGWEGGIVADPNCTTTGLVMTLKPILDSFGIKRVLVATMQATTGAGFINTELSPSAITDNVIPYINDEEEKTQGETLKILGKFDGEKIRNADIAISASCSRVNVDYGHMEDIFLETERPCEPEDIKGVMREFKGQPQELGLPSAPEHPIVVREEPNRPQPKFDVNEGNGMSVVVGKIRKDPVFKNGIKYTLLVHNTVRGGAGMAVLNAELLAAKGFFGKAM